MLPEKIPELIASRYRVIHPIGEGNMGTVYLVEHVYTGEELAMKVLQAHVGGNQKLVKRFKQEAWLPAKIRSNHVVRVIDADIAPELGNAFFLVMELLRGSDLEAYVQRQGKIPASEVVGIFWQVADALSKAHEYGIVHRDLKPENIFLHEHFDGRVIVKVLDFGISKMTGDGFGRIEEAKLTRTGAVLGTPLYMPPEQATGDTPRVGPPADMWALGLIAFRLLTGQVYWRAHTMAELLVEILTKPMEAPSSRDPSLPRAFDAWFLKACDRDPAKRFSSVWDQVRTLADSLGIGPPEPGADFQPAHPTVAQGQTRPNENEVHQTEHAETERSVAAVAAAKPPSNPPPPATMPSGALARVERERTHTRPSSRQRHNLKIPDKEAKPKEGIDVPDAKGSEPMQIGGGTLLKVHETLLPEGERRQLTILSCDVLAAIAAGDKPISPDKVRAAAKEYEDAFAQVIKSYKGQTAQPLGDGQLAYFGYPVAREDDARRAVGAALEILETAEKLNSRKDRPRLDVRVGVHTGLVLTWEITDDGSNHPAAIAGATPTMAWRLANLAKRNAVLLSGTTYKLVRNYYNCTSLGTRSLKGYSQPVETYQVSAESGAHSRIEGATTGRLTPMVGRDLELGLLLDRWARVEEGLGQMVVITGEAGIGKSRMTRVFHDRLETSPHTWIETRCLHEHRDKPLFPIAGLMSRVFVLLERDTVEEKISKLERALTHFNFPLAEMMPVFGALLGLPVFTRYPPSPTTTDEQLDKITEVLLAVLETLAQRRPVVLMVADLHWADPSTLAVFTDLVNELPTLRVLMLGTARPGFVAPWPMRSHVSTMTLSRLTPKRVKMMVDELTKGRPLPQEAFEQLIEKSDGVPLFVEELTKMLLESGLLVERDGRYEMVGPLPQFAIPSTLRDSLMARLDRLGSAKRVAQLGAILGREFTYDLIEAVSPLDPDTLQRELDRLVDADMLYQRGRVPRATYTFKYVLVQDTAYESLLHSTRQAYHRKIAHVMLQRSMAASQGAELRGTPANEKNETPSDQTATSPKDQSREPPMGQPMKNIRDVLREIAKMPGPLDPKDAKKRPQ